MAPVCQTCGDIGFEEALVFCDSCKIEAVHRYCVGITPTPFTEYITWICEDCDRSESESDSVEVDQTAKLTQVVKKSDNKKKKKKKKRKRKSSNHIQEVLTEDHGLQDATNVESMEVSSPPIKETVESNSGTSKRSDSSSNRKDVDETDKLLNISKTNEKEKKKKKKKKKKKEKKDNTMSSNPNPLVLAVQDHGVHDATNVEPEEVSSSPIKESMESKRQESSGSRKLHELTGLDGNGPSVSEAENSSSVRDHNSCTTKKRKVSTENRQLADGSSSCKEAESNMPQTSEMLTSGHYRAQPIKIPIWRGLMSVEGGNSCSFDGIVAHVSSLACPKVHDTASSLRGRLSAKILPRMEIWPKTFLKSGGPKDESIALYFFPSNESNDDKIFYSFVGEMRKNDLALRCVLDDAELLLFTSYMLPVGSWSFNSKDYLWGVFKPRQPSRR
ncbi:hypothetical protein CARUB_v10009144mg [Capsella rubella]|uniref:PHD-type domain-containing protein n=1 Tax=Capsella rubella TaxID=81985 RepID=R0ID34_9BRAS|nr:DNA ligase 1 [Capsella rubella]EOA40419.1 hypothetical protein CARUB_v10009144mg [Capsella rubella]